MGAFRQLGDPVCPACLCEHHGAAYAEWEPATAFVPITPNYANFDNNATVVQVQITITETCCIVVNAAVAVQYETLLTAFEIEQPLATLVTQQEDRMDSGDLAVFHYASWEVLPPGVYTYYLVNRSGTTRSVLGAWIKAIASDCEA